MNTKLESPTTEAYIDLKQSSDSNAQQLTNLDSTISDLLDKCEQSLSPRQSGNWKKLKAHINELNMMANQHHQMDLQEAYENEPTKKNTQQDLDDQINVLAGAIEIGRASHTFRGISDVFKALLMWKETPKEHCRI